MQRRLNGGQSCQQYNMEQNSWLIPEEEDQVVNFALDCAARGFPLDHKSLKQHVDTLLHAKASNGFPKTGVGKNWRDHFIQWHHARIQQFWSSPLESARGRAINEHTNRAWFNLLGNTIQGDQLNVD
jgi:hypothetical protein